ncbi:MAG: DUF6206 family protein [Thermoanaerobaculales bacterium]|nr:DUF6206 family protein [Thermoanaerobaculales bacterium]
MSDSPDVTGLAGLERSVDRALSAGDESGIEVLGYGEISCVLAWRDGDNAFAAKRLPLFDTSSRLEAYREAFDDYLRALAKTGIDVVASRLENTPSADGRIAAWCLQPLLRPSTLAPSWLRQEDAGNTRWLFERIADHIVTTVDPKLGLDGQLSNWAVVERKVLFFDVTTPMMRDDRGREALDTDLFLASLPWMLSGLVRRFMLHSILDKYYSPRGVLVDLLGNLIKEGIPERLPIGLEVVNTRIEPAIDEAEVHRYYREDAGMWALLQRLRRIDRAWQRRVRRRQYPFLLPGKVERHV